MSTPLDKTDLALIKRVAKRHAVRQARLDLLDDFVSDACLRLSQVKIPDRSNHRDAFITQTVKYAVYDRLRRVTLTPRRVLEKNKKGIPLTRIEARKQASFVNIEDVEFFLANPKPEFDPEQLADVVKVLDRMAVKYPLQHKVLHAYFIEGKKLPQIGRRLGFSGSRAHQIYKAALARLKLLFMTQEHRETGLLPRVKVDSLPA